MAHPAPVIPRLTSKEYLEIERDASCRHEFVDGIVYAMAGASRRHNLIAGNAFGALLNGLRPPCQVFGADMKVHVATSELERFYYPDVHVSCSDLDNDDYFSTQPVLVVEVLSPSTDELDRGDKFAAYCLLPSLQEYVLLHQSIPRAEVYRRRSGWQRECFEANDEIRLESVRITVPVSVVYQRVSF